MWATARLNQIPVVLSEDFEDGRVINGVQFLNPFSRTFDLATLFYSGSLPTSQMGDPILFKKLL